MTTSSELNTADYQVLFSQWGKKHGKEYLTDEEHDSRMSVFMTNDALIKAHNADQRHAYKLGHNEFSDLTFDEFKELYLPHHERPEVHTPEDFEYELIDLASSTPASKDWVAEGAVNRVQNQGQCGSCWAFSSTSAAEGANFIYSNVLKKFSEQDLIDCDSGVYGNSGCDGGVISYAFEYMIEHGQGLESDYPYMESKGMCKARIDRSQLAIKSYKQVPPNNEDALRTAVAQQPVSVAIEADQSHFQFYKGGVLTASGCGETLNHAVVAVGYGVDGHLAYWKVRNSWGETWGEDGYVRMERGVGGSGTCGIARSPSYPVAGDIDGNLSRLVHFALACVILLGGYYCVSYNRNKRSGIILLRATTEPLLAAEVI